MTIQLTDPVCGTAANDDLVPIMLGSGTGGVLNLEAATSQNSDS